MAYFIFDDIDQVKEFIGGGANVSIEMASISPIMHDAARDHLMPWLGKPQWAALVSYVTTPPGSPVAATVALLPYVRRALAHLTFYEYSKIGGLQFGESGIHRVETESMKGAYKYQEAEYRKYMLEKGYEAIEEMLVFLEENGGTYTLWSDHAASLRNRSLIINTAADFREAYSAYVSRYTFELLRPLIEDLELFALLPLLGQEQFDELKTAILEKTETDAQLALLRLLRKTVAQFAVREGSKRLWVRIEGRNVVQTEKLEPQSYEKETAVGNSALSLKLLQQDEWGNRHLSYVKKYLADHLEDFPLYSDYLDAQAAAAAALADGCLVLEDGTGNWQLENAPGALNWDVRGACPANCTCASCTGSTPKPPVFRL